VLYQDGHGSVLDDGEAASFITGHGHRDKSNLIYVGTTVDCMCKSQLTAAAVLWQCRTPTTISVACRIHVHTLIV
jgi:hypothetical protein